MTIDNYLNILKDKYGSLERAPIKPTLFLRTDPSRIEALKKFDPQGRLKDMANKIKKIGGTASLEEADLILLPDDCHLDQDHKLWRGQIGTRIKAVSNTILCEGIDSKRWTLSPHEKRAALGEAFEISHNDDVTGWDDEHFYATGLAELRLDISSLNGVDIQALSKITNSQLESMTPDQLTKLKSTLESTKNLFIKTQRFQQLVDARTDNLAQVIEQNLAAAKESRVIVVGGSGHLLDPRLIMRLIGGKVKYCFISPALGAKGVEVMTTKSLSQKIAALKTYYQA